MPQSTTDRNLLFGILALQMDFISRDALITAMNAWVLEKSKPLGQILLEQKALSADTHALLEALVQKHLALHGNDPETSLAAVSSVGSVRKDLEQIADPDVQASIGHLPPSPSGRGAGGEGEDPFATKSLAAGTATSAGTRFVILRPHAKGGLGEVFVARDTELNREVALKEIRDKHADNRDSRARFLLEAEITGGLEHPSIVPVYGLGTYADGRPFYAMRFIRGDSLMDAIKRFHPTSRDRKGADGDRTLELRQLLGRFIDVCQAIQYAHDRGVLHRDIKPGNIMLGKYGETLVVDWGLAKATGKSEPDAQARDSIEPPLRPASASGSAETIAGSAIGTPAYMSPEQAEGRLDLLGPASDVYGLGATLYALLTGKAPADGPRDEVLKKVRTGNITPPRHLDPSIDAPLEAVCLKAMALRRADRYAAPRQMAGELEHWLAGEPVDAWPEPWRVRARRWTNRHRVLVSSAAACLVVAAVALVVGIVLVSQANADLAEANYTIGIKEKAANDNWKEARANEKIAKDSEKTAKANEQSARFNLYATNMNLLEREWGRGNTIRLRQLLDAQRPEMTGGVELRNIEWYYWLRQLRSEVVSLPTNNGKVLKVCYSPDGEQLAAGYQNGRVYLWNTADGRVLHALPGHKAEVSALAFSGYNRRLASGAGDGTVSIWDAKTGAKELGAHQTAVLCLAFGNGDRTLASVSSDGSVKFWDVATGREDKPVAKQFNGITCAAFMNDLKILVSGDAEGKVRFHQLADGEEKLLIPTQFPGPVRCLSLNSNGTRLATGHNWSTGNLRVWDTQTGKRFHTIDPHEGNPINSVFFLRETQLASVALGGMIKIRDTDNGQEGRSIRTTEMGAVSCITFNPQGNRLAAAGADGEIKIWNYSWGSDDGGLYHPAQYTLVGNSVLRVGFSPDGKYVASNSDRTEICILDKATGKIQKKWHGHDDWIMDLAYSPDGRSLASCAVNDPTVRVWDIETQKELLRFSGHKDVVKGVHFSPDGTKIASASTDGTAQVWDAKTGAPLRVFTKHDGPVLGIAFSPDGQWVATVGGDAKGQPYFWAQLMVWSATTGELAFPPSEVLRVRNGTCRIAFSPNGELLACDSRQLKRELLVFNARTGKELTAFSSGVALASYGIAFSEDSSRLAAGTFRTVTVYDMRTFREVLSVYLDGSKAETVAFAKKSPSLAAGTFGGAVFIWDAAPPTWQLPIQQGENYIDLDWWDDAARTLESASAGKPPNPHALALLAMVRLRNEDRAGHRKACAQLLAAEMPDDDYRENLACWACVLGAEPMAQSEQVLNRAKRLVDQYPKVAAYPLVYGAALLRAGKLEEATKQLEAVGPQSITANLLLGITKRRQGRLQEGTDHLAKADELRESLKSTGAQSLALNRWRQLHWTERVRVEVLHRELKSVTEDSSAKPPP